MEHRTAKAGALACALTVAAVTNAADGRVQVAPAPAPTATPAPAPTPTPSPTTTPTLPRADGQLPPLPASAIGADLSRSLGTFASVAEAIDAAKAAPVADGAYATATVGTRIVAIDAAGTAYHVGWMTGSGNGQRPPQEPKGQ